MPAALLLEAARARMLVGDHAGAEAAARAGSRSCRTSSPWQLDRERGRSRSARPTSPAPRSCSTRALDGCGDDTETFLLAAEVASADIKQAKLVEKREGAAPKRASRSRPEASIVDRQARARRGQERRRRDRATTTARARRSRRRRRRRAARRRPTFGRAVVAYNKKDDRCAQNALELVIELDPSIYAAYLYLGDLVREKASPSEAFELAQKAVTYNPDFVDGWVMVGTLAHAAAQAQGARRGDHARRRARAGQRGAAPAARACAERLLHREDDARPRHRRRAAASR